MTRNSNKGIISAAVGIVAACACVSAWSAPDQDDCTTLNLRNGSYTKLPSNMKFVVPPEDVNMDGYYEAVLKVSFKPDHKQDPKMGNAYALGRDPEALVVSALYDGVPSGYSLNIGDSETNNGSAGDAGTQSNDAEMHIGRQPTTPSGLTPDSTVWVWGHDGYPVDPVYGVALSVVPQFVKLGDKVDVTVGNDRLAFSNKNTVSTELKSPWLYALANQADTEGAVNQDVYVALNRVVFDPAHDRLGSGVGQVKMCLQRKP